MGYDIVNANIIWLAIGHGLIQFNPWIFISWEIDARDALQCHRTWRAKKKSLNSRSYFPDHVLKYHCGWVL